MAARAYWSGQIRLALVSIPVQVFSATKSAARISFNQIHRPSGKRIRYEKVVPGIGPVDADEIVKGYEVEKGKYVLLEDDEIEGVKLEAKRTIDLVQFVDADDIDPVYFEKPLYVAPDEDEVAGEAYVVLRDALKETGKVGLGQLVVRGQSTLVALRPYGKGLMIETLRYPDEVQKADPFFSAIPDKEPEEELLTMAEELIRRKSRPFDPRAFNDPYEVALRELIDAKLENRPPEQIAEPEIGAKVINLMDALRRSMSTDGQAKGAGKGGKDGAAPARKSGKSAATAPAAETKPAKEASGAKAGKSKSSGKAGARSKKAA